MVCIITIELPRYSATGMYWPQPSVVLLMTTPVSVKEYTLITSNHSIEVKICTFGAEFSQKIITCISVEHLIKYWVLKTELKRLPNPVRKSEVEYYNKPFLQKVSPDLRKNCSPKHYNLKDAFGRESFKISWRFCYVRHEFNKFLIEIRFHCQLQKYKDIWISIVII